MKWLKKLFTRKPKKQAYNGNDQTVFEEKIHEGPKTKKKKDDQNNVIDGRFSGLHPEVVKRAQAVLKEAKAKGLRVDLFEGLRTFERQKFLYTVRKTTKAPPGRSWHNYGLAVDIVFKTPKGSWTWDLPTREQWQLLGLIGEKHGFTWGGRWGWDMAHFEIHPGFSGSKKALIVYNAKGITGVWNVVDRHLKGKQK